MMDQSDTVRILDRWRVPPKRRSSGHERPLTGRLPADSEALRPGGGRRRRRVLAVPQDDRLALRGASAGSGHCVRLVRRENIRPLPASDWSARRAQDQEGSTQTLDSRNSRNSTSWTSPYISNEERSILDRMDSMEAPDEPKPTPNISTSFNATSAARLHNPSILACTLPYARRDKSLIR
eukprot:8788251-Pyramimonas_sp.AAC.1